MRCRGSTSQLISNTGKRNKIPKNRFVSLKISVTKKRTLFSYRSKKSSNSTRAKKFKKIQKTTDNPRIDANEITGITKFSKSPTTKLSRFFYKSACSIFDNSNSTAGIRHARGLRRL